jgi:hypothetical protein
VQGWQRSAYWIDAGDGIPRYLDLGNGEAQWAYSEVYSLGYNWPEGADRLFDGDFEALVGRPDGAQSHRIVRSRLISPTTAFR